MANRSVVRAAKKGLQSAIQLVLEPPIYCGISNKFAEPESINYLSKVPGLTELPGVPFPCYLQELPSSAPAIDAGVPQSRLALPPSPQTKNKLLLYYALDVASLYPVLALDVTPKDTVLDMCAAPGGKAFALLQMLNIKGKGALALNDISYGRIRRLQGVLNRCLGKKHRESIRITQRYGEEWAKIERNEYDKVLVDAPCSSDRHNMESWMTKGTFHPKSEVFGSLQRNLLFAAIHAVKDGGVVVYSTCTEATRENDDVVSAVCESARKTGMKIKAASPIINSNFAALFSDNILQQAHGTLILPTPSLNVGPMYTSRLAITKK